MFITHQESLAVLVPHQTVLSTLSSLTSVQAEESLLKHTRERCCVEFHFRKVQTIVAFEVFFLSAH